MIDAVEGPLRRQSGGLADRVSAALRDAIAAGAYGSGDRLPGEIELTRLHTVSRTVVREAIAALRSEGLVEVRKGAGVFVLDRKERPGPAFGDLGMDRISALIELLELRTACESDGAALAAVRRSPSQLEEIYDAHREVCDCLQAGRATRDPDFRFHLAIAKATQNRRFPEFLELIRNGIISGGKAIGSGDLPRHKDHHRHLQVEHSRILDAIIEGDSEGARVAMRHHLQGSMSRFQETMRADASREGS